MGKNKRTDDSVRSRKKARTEKQQQEENPDESDISDTDKFSDDEEGGFRIDDIYIPPPLPATCSYESRGPRLIIMKIVNVNFKSYAGRVVVGPFDKSFSGIIGPNGSGKSNVIDSMLFVFGYRATKIRSKKVSVLIHKSEQHQNVSSCKVEVHFAQIIDGENGTYEKIPNSEIVISRTAFQNSSSFYELNNRKVQFKEVAMTLREHGIDLIHNRFLILQGEVEKIALMKPMAQNPHESGMLEYLEDIIGTTRYKEPLEKLEARVESLNQDRQDKIKLLQIVQDERNALRGPVEETVNFLKGENKITQLYNKKFQLILHQTNADISKTQEKKTTHVKKQQEIEKNLQEIQNKKGTEKTEIDSVNKTLQKMTKKYEEFNAIRQNAEKKKTGLTEELKQLKKTQKKTTENLKSEEEKLKGLLEVPEENQAEIEKLTKREAELDERRKKEEAVLQKVMSNIQKETKTFQEEKEKLQAEQLKIKKKHDEMRSAFELAKSERDIYVSTEQAEKNKLEQFVTKYQDIKETLIQKKNELSSLQKELPQKEKTLKKAEEDLREIRGKDTSITQDLRNFQSQLEDKKSSMSANHSNDRVKNFIMKLKAEGKVPGIFGRLGDLGAIDKKYDVAISTACPGLDHFVVDTSDHIGQIIKALKENNAGRATFIALDKIDELYRRRNANFKGPENTPALFDFVRVQDERVRPAFYFVIRQTLVVDTIEQAKRVGYDYGARYRVVTLDGSVIETTGTMSGGGNQKIRGKMGSSVTVSTDPNTAEEVVKLERRVSALEVELQRFREKERECEEIISTLEPEIRAMKANINKLTIAIQGLTKQEPELKTQIENQKKKVAECAPNENRLCELSKKVQDTEKGARKAEQEANAIEEKVLAVHNKIMEITGGKTKEAQKRLDDITEERDKTRNNITKLQVAIKSAERNTKKTKERIENMRTELKEKEERTAEIETEMDTVKEDCELSSERANELKTQMEEKQQRLEKLQEEYKNFLGDVNQLKAEKLRVEQEIEEVNKELQNLEKKVPAAKHELKKLTLNEIPTFQEPSDDEGQNVEEPEETNRPVENANDPNVLAVYDAETMATWRSEDIDSQIANEKEHLKEFNPNMNTLNDFKRKTIQYIERNNELKEITKRRNTCREGLKTVSGNRNKEFMNGFTAISGKLKEIYQQLAPGGDAELDLYDSMNPFSEGINFCVRPPKKSWKNITNLSGGEKTLSSLALVFALHYYRPTPLYVMDEIDAALDFKNVLIVARYIKDRTKNAQFIVISLRTQMFEVANKLTGIYKTFNCTKSVTMCPAELCRDNPSTSSARISQEYQAPSTSMARISPEHQAPSGSGGMSPERNSDMPSTNSRGISPERHMPPPHQTLVPPEEQRKRKTKQRFSNDLAQSNEEYNSDKENADDTDMSEIDSNESDVDKLEKIRRNAVIKHTNPAEIESSKETINFSDVDRDSNESEILRAAEIRENQRATRRSSRSSHESSQETDLKTVLERYQNNRPSRNA